MTTLAPTAIAGLRSWGSQLERAASELPAPPRPTVASLDAALPRMGVVDADVVHTSGWEMTQALAPRNDNRCGQKALLAAHAVTQRSFGGDMSAALRNLAVEDGRVGAVLTAPAPRGVRAADGQRFTSHSAPVFRTPSGEYLVIDDLVSDAPDSVIGLDAWISRVGTDRHDLLVTSALADIPTLPAGGLGAWTKPIAADGWPRVAEALADSWAGLPYDRHPRTH